MLDAKSKKQIVKLTTTTDSVLFKSAKAKLFSMLDTGVKSKKTFAADSNFWRGFKIV